MQQGIAARVVLISPEDLREMVASSVRVAVADAMQSRRIKGVMTEPEAAEYLGFAPNTLRQWRVEGIGPRYAKPAGKAIRYRKDDLDAWLADGMLATADHRSRG